MEGNIARNANLAQGLDVNRAVLLDKLSGDLEVIQHSHSELHEGNVYSASVTTSNLGGETGDIIQIHFTTGNGSKRCHMTTKGQSSGGSLFTFSEAPTGGLVGGTAFTPLNHKRESANTSELTNMKTNGSRATGGTQLINEYIGQNIVNQGISTRVEAEWLLKPNTSYAITIYDTSNVTASISINWYEVAKLD